MDAHGLRLRPMARRNEQRESVKASHSARMLEVTAMKSTAKYVLTMLGFILVSYALSWLAVYNYWIGARWFHSVSAIRAGDAIGSVILAPVRLLFWLAGDFVDQSAPLLDPKTYARINAALLGIIAYSCCRSRLFGAGKDKEAGRVE